MDKVPLTVAGADKLHAELEELKTVTRPRIVEAIATARAHGDLKENAEYHAAREQQSFSEGRINEIEAKLANAQVIDVTTIDAKGKVIFGATVEIEDLGTQKKVIYQIVGQDEADIKAGRISVGSPIARAMIGKEEEDVITVKAPGGEVDYEILSIQYI
ncbi:MAG: transcription elongation factor GreA [Gammaproteobacteria bacterium]|jgi:transcription elongation factor GreA|nr:transcription elongation factor GreA [Gammaproteobacteria bacterium]MBT4145542.1 transcription elongation factor GreA [Gammaproteobacteria bacterium]MBT5222684.1 transcription elongation factor GreA [Gammaproteobacteria bacterium]MBT5826332.1 transcription elongation factor GreA [Gammaproteobacteria bacterium]MBT5966473.1 transcription elongation factor GreA [Gammaproteobacteria bacterium]